MATEKQEEQGRNADAGPDAFEKLTVKFTIVPSWKAARRAVDLENLELLNLFDP